MKSKILIHIFSGNNVDKSRKPKGIAKFCSRVFGTIASKLLPNEYEGITSARSTLSFNSDIMKMSNLVSFNPKNNNEAYCFTSDGSFYLFTINYETKVISKIYECNMKDLRLII
jgi:hypothetical protein